MVHISDILATWPWGKNRKDRRDKFNPIRPEDLKVPQQLTYHMEEFKALKAEIAELIKVAYGHLSYALLASAGIYSWLLTSKCASGASSEKLLFHTDKLHLLWLLPLIVSLIFATLAGTAYLRIGHIGQYIDQLETLFALRVESDNLDEAETPLGWERSFARRAPIVSGIYFVAWMVLLAGNIVIAILMWNSQACT
jgi:hypothetical protein